MFTFILQEKQLACAVVGRARGVVLKGDASEVLVEHVALTVSIVIFIGPISWFPQAVLLHIVELLFSLLFQFESCCVPP